MSVQITSRPPAPNLRYIDQVVAGSNTTLEVRYAPGRLRHLDVDVVHVADEHLDTLIGAPRNRPLRWALATTLMVLLLRFGRIALVRRIDPSTTDKREPWLIRVFRALLDGSTTMFVGFDATASFQQGDRFTVIPHAHYRDRFAGYPRGAQVPGRVLCIGASQLGRHVDKVVDAMKAARTPGVTGRLAGPVSDDAANRLITASATHPATISARLDVLSDGAHIQEIDASELVVAPGTDTLEQLQIVFLALSLDRPVLTRRTDAMVQLAADTGEGWLHLYDGGLTGADLDAALASTRAKRTTRPNLDGRDLNTVRAAYADIFRQATVARRSQKRWPGPG